jgi:benzoate-CoA ligase
LLQVKEIDRYDLSSIRLCGSGGEPLPAHIYEVYRERFEMEILDLMGCTEVSWYIAERPGRVKPGSTGEAIPGHELKIVDEKGQEVPPGVEGELLVKADSVAPYYWNKHERTKEAMIGGDWFRTGDIFHRDEDGYFWFRGRADDMIKAGGIKVVPTEVEATLIKHPAVVEAGVAGVPDEDGLMKPKAFVVLAEGYKPSPELARELQQFVKNQIAPYNYPRWVEFISELPKTPSGKVQRYKLRGF